MIAAEIVSEPFLRNRTQCERNVLRGLVQKPLVYWPNASVLQDGDFVECRGLFAIVRGMICSALKERREQAFSEELLTSVVTAMDLPVSLDIIGSLFEHFHESRFAESVSFLRKDRILTPDDIDAMNAALAWCRAVSESPDGKADGSAVPESLGRTFAGKWASELWDLAEKPVVWLVENVFSCDQPTIFGAKQKSLKTTLLTDLAVSLASGYPWLGRFEIPQKRRVLFVTGEASEAAAIRKVKRAANVRNMRREDFTNNLRIEALTFPTLPSLSDCEAIHRAVHEHGIEVVLIDPLYMGLSGLNTASLTEVGPAMRQFMAHCRPANVIIAHHVKKTASYDDAPNLEDLSQAGIAEFAGNYWLMGRMSEYTGDGMHSLAIRYGGRDEQFGLLKLEFDERAWTAEFSDLMGHREDIQRRKETEKTVGQLQAMKGHLSRHGGAASLAKLAEAAGTKTTRESFQRVVDELCDSGQYERFQTKAGNNKPCEGLRVKGQISTDSVL